jgi:hypothetical protein
MVPSFTDDPGLKMAAGSALWSWRCVNCGECLDQIISENRRRLKTMGVTDKRARFGRRRWPK